MPTREPSQIEDPMDTGTDEAPVLLENCYYAVLGDGERGRSLPSPFSLSRLSFRWQVSLLGTLLVILSLAVSLAIVATLRYTKSAVLSSEKKRLAETARSLAQEYENRADSARRGGQQSPLDLPNAGTSQEVLALMSRLVTQNQDGVGGGFYSSTADRLIGNFYPIAETSPESAENRDIPTAERQAVLEIARTAATTRQTSERVVTNSIGFFLISAIPIREGYSTVGSAWAVKRITDLPGANRIRAYLT